MRSGSCFVCYHGNLGPAGVYNQPHFDVHFYLVTLEERNLITSTAKMYVIPASEYLPQDYELSPNTQPAFLAPIKQPDTWQKPGLYPAEYRIDHGQQFDEFTVALTKLLSR